MTDDCGNMDTDCEICNSAWLLTGRQAYALGPSWERRLHKAHSGPYHHDPRRYNYEHGHAAPGGHREPGSARTMRPDDAARVRFVSLVALHRPSCRMHTQIDVCVLFLHGDTLVVSRMCTAHPKSSIEEDYFRRHRCLCVRTGGCIANLRAGTTLRAPCSLILSEEGIGVRCCVPERTLSFCV